MFYIFIKISTSSLEYKIFYFIVQFWNNLSHLYGFSQILIFNEKVMKYTF